MLTADHLVEEMEAKLTFIHLQLVGVFEVFKSLQLHDLKVEYVFLCIRF